MRPDRPAETPPLEYTGEFPEDLGRLIAWNNTPQGQQWARRQRVLEQLRGTFREQVRKRRAERLAQWAEARENIKLGLLLIVAIASVVAAVAAIL